MATDYSYLNSLNTNNKVGTFESMLAGVGSGLIQIPKGLFSLGATLLDLGVNSGKAAAVEQWFDDLTNLDEKAEATAAGKITELLVNIGVPGGYGFKLGSHIAKQSMLAKKGGKYLDLSNKSLKKGVEQAATLNAKGKTNRFFAGALAGGLAEGVFVGDVEKVGSLGDLMGGPTKIDRGEGTDAVRDLLNRAKFGTEGALFTGVLGGIGSTAKRLAGYGKKVDAANGKLDAWIDKFASGLRARSGKTQEFFDIATASKGASGADTVLAKNISRDTDRFINKIFPPIRTMYNKTTDGGGKTAAQNKDILLREINDLLVSGEPKLVDEVRTILNPEGRLALKEINQTSKRTLTDEEFIKQLSPEDATKFTERKRGMVSKWGSIAEENWIEEVPGGDDIKYKGWRELTKKLVNLGVKDDDIGALKVGLGQIRQRWDDLFTALGRTLDPSELREFKAAFGDKFKDYLGATYDFMQNKSILPWLSYQPTEEAINEVKKIFQNTYDNLPENKAAGRILSDLDAEQYVAQVLDTAKMPKGMRMDKPSDPYFALPDFFAGKTVLNDAAENKMRLGKFNPNLSQLEADVRPAFETLLGKQFNPMQTILGGTAKLSMLAQRNIFLRNIFNKNEEMLVQAKKELDATGKTNIKPMMVKDRDQAFAFYGDRKNWKQIEIIDEAQEGRVGMSSGASNPFGARGADVYYATKGVADALAEQGTKTNASSIMGSEMLGQLYSGLILYPKATSQIAKTILSPVTHMRNFVSAGAFAAANGIMPMADPAAVKQAYQALQTGLKGTRMQNELYEKLLKLGVVNSNVRLGDLSRLLQDVNFGETMTYQKGFRGMMKQLSKVKSIGQDLYTAEDDFWKIYSWAIEKSRMAKAFEKQGLVRGKWFKDGAGNQVKLTEEWLEREAADIVKNNIPNYDYVPDFVKALRKLPIGNFVSFPAEIARTGTNIVQRALREINMNITLPNGQVVKPLQGIGYTRLFGFTTTVAAIPYATTKMFQALYDVTDEEREAIRRYVAKWSKNSTILPIKQEDGSFKYIDFSHANAYDTLIRPLQTVVNAVADGQPEDGIMDDFLKGTFSAMAEFGEPFITESIWTEAVSDLMMRGGRTRDGFQVYNQEDSGGNKATKIMQHLVKAQMPFSFDQLKRLDRSIKQVDVITKIPGQGDDVYDKYGQDFEFGDELGGLFGFRAVNIDPDRTIKFKVSEYKKGVRDSGSLFTRETLKGGPIEPKEIVDAYINANRALFNVKKNFSQDLEAAKILGISDEAYNNNLDISGAEKNAIENGVFRPYVPSIRVRLAFAENASEIGESNPYDNAADAINSIRDQLQGVSLSDPEFPLIDNPLVPMNLGTTIPNIQTGALNLPSVSANTLTNQGGTNQFSNLTTNQKIDILFGKG